MHNISQGRKRPILTPAYGKTPPADADQANTGALSEKDVKRIVAEMIG